MTAITTAADDLTGAELRARRQALGLTMAELGALLDNVHWNTISRWERGVLKMKHPGHVKAKLAAIERSRRAAERKREKKAAATPAASGADAAVLEQ